MTYAIHIETTPEARHWRCEGWEIVTWPSGTTNITAPGEGDTDVDINVCIDGGDLDVFAERSHYSATEHSGERVTIPLPVLRELVRLMEMQAERLEETSDERKAI